MAEDFASASDIEIAIKLLTDTKNSAQNVKTLKEGFDSLTVSANKAKAAVASVGNNSSDNGLIKLSKDTKLVSSEFQKLTPAIDNTNKSFRQFKNTIEGTLTAIGIFQFLQAIITVTTKVIDSITQLEQAFYKLAIAEKAISQAGVDITPRQLADIAKSVTDTYATISKIDSLKMISNLAVLTKDLKLTTEEYKKLAMAIPLVAQQAGVSIEDATNQVINGLTKNGKGWADLGITVNAEILRQGAVKDGLVATAEAYDNLTAEQQQTIKTRELINILDRNTNVNLGEQAKYMETVSGKLGILNKLWETLTTTGGETFSIAIKTGLDIAINGMKGLVSILLIAREAYIIFFASLAGGWFTLNELVRGHIKTLKEFQEVSKNNFINSERQMRAAVIPQLGEDTPTGTPEVVDNSKHEDILGATKKFNDEILQAQIKFSQDMQDVEIDLGRKMVDITAEYAKKRADAEKDYTNKVFDINASYRDKISSIKQKESEASQKNRDDELKRERAFQEKMQEMRERFLMNLDDALHARDARQILRLIKNYNLEKLQAERQHTLDAQNAQLDNKREQSKFAQERKDAENERKAKLAEAQRDYNDKVAKLKADEDAEVQAAVLAANRKIQDLEKNNADRLAIIASNLVSEFNLTAKGLSAIASLYHQYYADISGVYAAMQAMMAGTGLATGKANGNEVRNSSGTTSPSKQPSNTTNKRFAEGGSMLANQPTNVTFGDGGELELATFTPIGRNGKDVNKLFSNLSGGNSSGGGTIGIELLLSPDLESRIVKNTLGKTAEIFTKIQRNKN